MQKVLTAEEMRMVDRLTTEKYGISSLSLMENAARSVARVITENAGSVKDKRIIVLCGTGNNGGDGTALARMLWNDGANCWIYLVGDVANIKGDAKTNLDKLKDKAEGTNRLHLFKNSEPDEDKLIEIDPDFIVDALFGFGLSRPLDKKFGELFETFNKQKSRQKQLFVSIDLPSGLMADAALPIGDTFQADLTVTFTAPKLANVFPPASHFNGEVMITDIGSPVELIDNSPSQTYISDKEDAQKWLEQTKFTPDSYKNRRGNVILVAGSRDYPGAAVLSASAAMRSGAGLVTLASPGSSLNLIAPRLLPEIIIRSLPEASAGAASIEAFNEIQKLSQKADAVAIGSGLSADEQSTKDLVRKVVENRLTPVLIDADGLNALAPFEISGSDELPLILTPHEGEFLRLLGTTDKTALADRIAALRSFAQKHHVILVLKGERTLIGEPCGKVVINPTGNSGLGKAGNGDTLTGIIAGFAAQAVQLKVDMFETVVAAVYFAGVAADIAEQKYGKRVMTASDVRECLADAFAALTDER